MLRMHWGAYKRLKKAVEVQIVAFGDSIPDHPIDPCEIKIVRNYGYRKRAFDADNLVGSAKIVIDCLRDLDIIVDDRPAHMRSLEVDQTKSPEKASFVQILVTTTSD